MNSRNCMNINYEVKERLIKVVNGLPDGLKLNDLIPINKGKEDVKFCSVFLKT